MADVTSQAAVIEAVEDHFGVWRFTDETVKQVIEGIFDAGFVVVPRVEAILIIEDADQWCSHVEDQTYGHRDRFRAALGKGSDHA